MSRKDDKDESLDAILERIDRAYEAEDLVLARKELSRARKLSPGDPTVREWEAVLAADEGHCERALAILEGVLETEPDRPFAAMERARVLMELWRVEEALAQLRNLLESGLLEGDAVEEASARFDAATCLDFLGRAPDADREFREAARLAPEDFSVPVRMPRADFESLVARALDSIPARFHPYLSQVTVLVRDYPSRAQGAPSPSVLGLYCGVPRTERTQDVRDNLDTVFVFQRSHELLNLPDDELREEVRKTVIHEIAHHFGLGEDEMGDYA